MIGGGTCFLANFSVQFTFAVVTIRIPSVMMAPIVIVSPVRPSKKKLEGKTSGSQEKEVHRMQVDTLHQADDNEHAEKEDE